MHAIRRVEARWRESAGGASEIADIIPILEAVADAVDRNMASLIDTLSPRPPLRLSLHLIDLLEDELLTLWRSGRDSAAEFLDLVSRVRMVRGAVERRFRQLPGAPLAGLDALEFLIEFVHDLRSPLSSLILLADRLQRGLSGPLTPLQLRQLRLIYGASHALNTVTNNALQLTRDRDQLEEPEARPFSVTRLLSEVQDLVRVLAVQKGLEIRFIRPNVDRRVGHPIELQRILLNLVTNAIKFTRTGGITVSATDVEPNRVEFAVQDSGAGIPAHAQETLFQPFRRLGNGSHATFSATGLGLAITQRLVRALGGWLRYDTVLEKGTRFYFVLDLPMA
ncbi:MAG: sensor histidine kinase [Gemmatimonadota bacterium]